MRRLLLLPVPLLLLAALAGCASEPTAAQSSDAPPQSLAALFGGPAAPTSSPAAEFLWSGTGHVKWFNAERGHGFISSAGRSDVLFHRTGLEDPTWSPQDGQWVRFDVMKGPSGGPYAEHILPAN